MLLTCLTHSSPIPREQPVTSTVAMPARAAGDGPAATDGGGVGVGEPPGKLVEADGGAAAGSQAVLLLGGAAAYISIWAAGIHRQVLCAIINKYYRIAKWCLRASR